MKPFALTLVLLSCASPAWAGGFAQGPKLLGSGAVGAAEQGHSVAISADGNTAVVGGPADDSNKGAVWFFTRANGVWMQQGPKKIGLNAVGAASQGWSVAISADGNTVIEGGPEDNTPAGAAWVFTRTNGVWSQQGPKLIGATTGPANQGSSVALSADGNTALVGGIFDAAYIGAAWVFTRSGGVWSPQGGKLVANDSSGASYQGYAVALSSDGNTAIVGGTNDASGAGAVWVYTRSGATWTQQGNKLVGTGASGPAQQGAAVALSSDGNTLIEGGWGDNSYSGAFWAFTRSGVTWSQQGAKLVGGNSTGIAGQGAALGLSADGNTAVSAGPLDNTVQGALWVFRRSGGTWSQFGDKLVGVGQTTTSQLGYSVGVSSDANTIAAGALADSGNIGGAFIFTRFCGHGDVSGDGATTVSDVFYLINYLFASGPAPACY